MKPERPRLAALVLEIRRRFAEQNLPAPNYRAVCRRVETLDLRLVTTKRESTKKAGPAWSSCDSEKRFLQSKIEAADDPSDGADDE